MVMKNFVAIAIVLALSLPFATAVHGQHYSQDVGCDVGASATYGYGGCDTGGYYGGHGYGSSSSSLGYYHRNCGRKITTRQAAGLWSSYCSDDCGFEGGHGGCGGCGHGCRLLGRGLGHRCGGGGILKRMFRCHQGGQVVDDCGYESGCCDDYSGGGHHGIGGGIFGRRCCFLGRIFQRGGGFGSGLGSGWGAGCGCSCYQGCFGYGGGFNSGSASCDSGCDTGYGGFGHGCRLRGMFSGCGSSVRSGFSRGCGLFRNFGNGCCLFGGLFRHNLSGIGCYGYDGGYFYNPGTTTLNNFGYYSSGCGCDGACNNNGNQGVSSGYGAPVQYQYSQPVQNLQPNCNVGPTNCNPLQTSPSYGSGVPIDANSLSPASEVVPGEVVGEAAASGGGA